MTLFCGLILCYLPICVEGGVAHMVEHSLCMRGARGSIPRISIILFFFLFFLFFYYILSLSYYPANLIFFKKRQWQDSNLRSRWKLLSRQPPWPLGHIVLYHYIFSVLPVLVFLFIFPTQLYYPFFFPKTTVAGFEPTHPEDNWFQVNRLRPLGHTVYTFLSFVRLSLPFSVPFIYPLPIPTLLFFILPSLLSWLASYSTFFPFYFCNLQ